MKYNTYFQYFKKNSPYSFRKPRSHSYCQCDRNFGAYSNVLRKTARMATTQEYDKIISSKSELVHGYQHLKNWSASLLDYFLEYKNIVSKKTSFKIQQYCRLQYNPSGTISASSSYLGSFIPFNFLVKGANLNLFIPEDIPGMPRKQLKPAKEKDLTSLFCFLSAEEQCWFNDVIEKPKVDDNVVAENEESDIEEESDYENILAYEFP
ncbi:hypothetical protein J6590_026088 [Homalodisca vitripennis]|nr:hypothetical protein J6590_026088 [Homalodisca vitripennis]